MTEREFYLTKEGLLRMKRELKKLLALRLKTTQREVPKILESEEPNPEYFSFQEELEVLERKIADLKQILQYVHIILPPPRNKRAVVNLGAAVLVKTNGQTEKFELVGTLETNPSLGKISNESPLGKALIGHKVGEEVMIQSSIPLVYKILKISYSHLRNPHRFNFYNRFKIRKNES